MCVVRIGLKGVNDKAAATTASATAAAGGQPALLDFGSLTNDKKFFQKRIWVFLETPRYTNNTNSQPRKHRPARPHLPDLHPPILITTTLCTQHHAPPAYRPSKDCPKLKLIRYHHGKSTNSASCSESWRVFGGLPDTLPIWCVDDKFGSVSDNGRVGGIIILLYGWRENGKDNYLRFIRHFMGCDSRINGGPWNLINE